MLITFSYFHQSFWKAIVIRSRKIVWKLKPNGPLLLNNLRTAENLSHSFSRCNRCKQTISRENQTLLNLTQVKFLIAINSVITFYMSEDNCAIPGCSTSRATPGVALLGTLPCLIVVVGTKLHILKKNPSSSFNYYKRVT